MARWKVYQVGRRAWMAEFDWRFVAFSTWREAYDFADREARR